MHDWKKRVYIFAEMKDAGTVDLNCGNGSSSLPSSPPTTFKDRKLI